MPTNDNQDKKCKQYAIDFIRKGRYFSPKVSTLIVLNILALASKVSAVHNWNETSSNYSLRHTLSNGVLNQSQSIGHFNSSYLESDSDQLFHLFSDVNTYGRNKAEDILNEQQKALIDEPLEGFKVLNYDELNKLINEVITSTQTTPLISIPTYSKVHLSSHMDATSTFYFDTSSSTRISEVSNVQEFDSFSSYYNQTSGSNTNSISSVKETNTESKKTKVEIFTPTKTVDTPHWLLDSVITSSFASKTSMDIKTTKVKNKPIFLKAKKFSNKNNLPGTNSTRDSNNRSIGLTDIFESKGSILNKAINMVAILTFTYLVSTIYT